MLLQMTLLRSFLWLSGILLYICTTSSSPVHLSMDNQVVGSGVNNQSCLYDEAAIKSPKIHNASGLLSTWQCREGTCIQWGHGSSVPFPRIPPYTSLHLDGLRCTS